MRSTAVTHDPICEHQAKNDGACEQKADGEMNENEIDKRDARRMLTLEQVLKALPVGKSTLKRMISRNEFPKPHYISPNKRVWYDDELLEWQGQLPANRRAGGPS